METFFVLISTSYLYNLIIFPWIYKRESPTWALYVYPGEPGIVSSWPLLHNTKRLRALTFDIMQRDRILGGEFKTQILNASNWDVVLLKWTEASV